ncbi:MAG: asparaginase [Clostridia bacterium]|nr:asparaginase [Clostridia bacterium]
MKKNKICVIFTGGTIGSSVQGDAVDLDGRSASLLINGYTEKYGSDVVFDELKPVSILSENVQSDDLYKMVDCVRGVDYDSYDGIILTHGTDTLCFTANYFSQIFADLPIPLVMVSSLYPLDDVRSNGGDNFASAVAFIMQTDCHGVFVSFRNPYGDCKIHLASRLTEARQISGKFGSLMDVHFGVVKDGRFIYNESAYNPTLADVNVRVQPYGSSLCNNIVVIKARALLDFTFYRFDNVKPKAVIIELYHSGTICTAGEDTNFLSFLKYCNDLCVPVILSPIDSKANVYASAKSISGKCIFSCDRSFEMTIVKVMLALGANRNINEVLNENRFFEKIR